MLRLKREQRHGRYDLVNRIFTFGQDRNWRKKAVEECLGMHPDRCWISELVQAIWCLRWRKRISRM